MLQYQDVVSTNKVMIRHTLWVALTSLILALISFFFFDQKISLYFSNENLMPFRKFARELTDIGLGENFFVLSMVTFVVAHWLDVRSRKNPEAPLKTYWAWLRRWAANFFFALLSSGIITLLLKFLIGRQRPHKSDTFESHIFLFFQSDSHFQSLPSGHSQVVFCVATMTAFLWPRLTWLMYGIALFLAFTRVIVHSHFLSDILIGSAIGHLGTIWYLRIMEKRFPGKFSLIR